MEFSGNYRDYPEAFIIQDIQNMISEIKNFGAKCLFVTAPDARVRKPALMAAIAAAKKAVGTECEFFDSTLVTNYPLFGGDGVHYNFPLGEPIAKKWAQRVYERFVELNY